ncbi:DUF3501 family protein [Kaarinaea lacus]
MSKLTRQDLMSLEQYAERRPEFRQKVIAHKKNRQVSVSPHTTLYFEDRLTIQYQVQEMLRIERIFEAAGIEEELGAYNALIPDGANFKATFMIEYEDENERKEALKKLIGIEDKVWVQVSGFDKVLAIADEDLDRENEVKTSAVHFLRFELDEAMVAAAKQGADINIGIDHPNCQFSVEPIAKNIRDSLVDDLRPAMH